MDGALQAANLSPSMETQQKAREMKEMCLIDCLLSQRGKLGLPAHIFKQLQHSVISVPPSVTKTHHDRMREVQQWNGY